MKDLTVVDVAQLSPVTEPFCDLQAVDGRPIRWVRHSGLPGNWLERKISRPQLSRYRAVWNAASDAGKAAAVVSHMPWTTAAVSLLMKKRSTARPQLAFSFNFTKAPSGSALSFFRKALAPVEQFAVFTEFEADLYAERLGLPRERFRPVLWTQAPPVPGTVPDGLVPDGPFVVAIGGEGRDFSVLKAAAAALPDLPFVVIARPTAMLDDAPPNMRLLFNLPWATCWGIASRSIGLLVPLISKHTCCGHITLVSGRMAGLPIVTTTSSGTTEYSQGFDGTLTIPAGDVDGWVEALRLLRRDGERIGAAAAKEAGEAVRRHDRSLWAAYTADFLRRVT